MADAWPRCSSRYVPFGIPRTGEEGWPAIRTWSCVEGRFLLRSDHRRGCRLRSSARKPDFFFLWLYAVLSYLPASLETPFLLIAPVLGIAGLVALPFYAGEGEKSWHRRPIAILMLTAIAVAWGVFTHLGTFTPWSPNMSAWSGGPPIPIRYTHDASPLERQGAIVFQSKQCRNCHSIAGA